MVLSTMQHLEVIHAASETIGLSALIRSIWFHRIHTDHQIWIKPISAQTTLGGGFKPVYTRVMSLYC